MRIWFVVGLLAALVLGTNIPTSAQKPDNTAITEIGGKTMQQWIEQLKSADPSKRENAIRTILLFGPDRAYEAVPTFLEKLGEHKTKGAVDLSVRVNLAIALGVVLGNVKDPEENHVKKAVTLLSPFLTDSQAIMKYRTAQALGQIGPDAKSAIPQLMALTRDFSTWETRQAAALALGKVATDKKNGPSKNVLYVLFESLGDKSAQVRLAAIQSLAWLGPPNDPVLQLSLIKSMEPVAQKDPDPSVQVWAQMAIMSVTGKVLDRNLEPIGKMLVNSNEMAARIQAAQAIGSVGDKAKSQIPALHTGLRDKEPLVIYWCIWGLGQMGNWAMAAVPDLQKLSDDSKQPEPIKKAAEDACGKITGLKKILPKGVGP